MRDYDIKKLEELVVDGLTVKEISNGLNISISTVKRLMSKYELKSQSFSLKRESKECLNCQKHFSSLIIENRKFCSSSCSSSYNNLLRPKKKINCHKKKRIRVFRERKIGVCENCKLDIIRKDGRSQAKFCSPRCQADFRMTDRIENNKASVKTLKLFLKKQYGEKCMKCGWSEINPISGKVPIELEHIDGNSENNKLENLTLLCPNCYSLTPTYKGLNRGKGRHKRRERYKEGKSY